MTTNTDPRSSYWNQPPAQTNGDARQFWQDNMARVYVRAVAKYLGIGLLITAGLALVAQAAR